MIDESQEDFERFRKSLSSKYQLDFGTVQNLWSLGQVSDHGKKEVILDEQGICRKVYFILSGMLKRVIWDQEANEKVLCFCLEGELSTDFKSLTTRVPSEIGIVTTATSRLWSIDIDSLTKAQGKDDSLGHAVYKLLSQTLLSHEDQIRVSSSISAEQRYQTLLQEASPILRLASVSEIASYLGVTRRTLSRIRKNLR